MSRYARFLSHYPYVVLLIVLVVVSTCLVVILTMSEELSFEDPLAGFEPRGTEIAERLVTLDNLLQNVDSKTNLFPFRSQHHTDSDSFVDGFDRKYVSDHDHYDYNDERKRSGPNRYQVHKQIVKDKGIKIYRSRRDESTDTEKLARCGTPDKRYARIIVTSAHYQSLFNLDDLKNMCDLDKNVFITQQAYRDVCVRSQHDGPCCRAWTVGSYVALLAGKPSCENITSDDVDSVLSRLVHCAPFFHNFSLVSDCMNEESNRNYCPGIPAKCVIHNAVYHILYYLTDTSFISKEAFLSQSSSKSVETALKYSSIFLPIGASSKTMPIFQNLDKVPRKFKGVTIVGAHFGVKYALFEKYLVLDSIWLGIACGVIFVAMWLYTTSIFVTFMAFLSMFFALEVSYFLYTFIFKINFFPYMNMVTLIVMIGIGADDLFIYCKMWHMSKAEKNNGVLEKIISDTLSHTILSMLVTSLTTAAAFYANYISDISAIKCFSVFAGTTVVVNFILTITWLPASIMLYEKWCRCCVGLTNGDRDLCKCLCKLPYKIYYLINDWSRMFFERLLPCLVIKFRYMWIILFGALWIGSAVVVFYRPRLKLPNSEKFQVFASDHLLERYDFEFSQHFHFELGNNDEDEVPVFPITVVWGVLARDNGDPLDPYNKGSLTYDPDFDLTTAAAQAWILEFCSRLRHTSFYLHTQGLHLTDCFLENFVKRYMKRPCGMGNAECCNQTLFPFHKSKMVSCLSAYIPDLSATPWVNYGTYSPGPRFDDGRISAFYVQFLSNHSFSRSYETAHSFYSQVNDWVNEELLYAPKEMQKGWFISDLGFYDLQSSLALGTPLALGVSLSVAAVVSFFTTLNVLVSAYALLTIAATISVTIAALVLMQWKLDVLESVVITVAIGMAVDFTLHYGVAFRLSPDFGREMRVINSIGRMASPVTMAAATTSLAGAFMMPSTVLAYRKFGIFMLLLVSIAWFYATFFFQSLLRTIGPNGGFGQFSWPASNCCSAGSREHVDKTVYALSQSTLSSSSTSPRDHIHNHSHSRKAEPTTDCHPNHSSHRHHYYNSDSTPHIRKNDPQWQNSPRHHHHRPRSKGQYISVKTYVHKPEMNRDDGETTNKDAVLSPCSTSIPNTNGTACLNSASNSAPSEMLQEASPQVPDHGSFKGISKQGTTQAQIETLPHSLSEKVAFED